MEGREGGREGGRGEREREGGGRDGEIERGWGGRENHIIRRDREQVCGRTSWVEDIESEKQTEKQLEKEGKLQKNVQGRMTHARTDACTCSRAERQVNA